MSGSPSATQETREPPNNYRPPTSTLTHSKSKASHQNRHDTTPPPSPPSPITPPSPTRPRSPPSPTRHHDEYDPTSSEDPSPTHPYRPTRFGTSTKQSAFIPTPQSAPPTTTTTTATSKPEPIATPNRKSWPRRKPDPFAYDPIASNTHPLANTYVRPTDTSLRPCPSWLLPPQQQSESPPSTP